MSEEFKNRLLVHAKTVVDRAVQAQSEEATKQFLIIPFFQLLGYDPHDPEQVIPEADASFSDKFKNRVDYAISKEGVPVIAVETKKVGSLSAGNRGELKGYYNAVIRNPVVDCGYAEETRVVASCEHKRTRTPLQESQRSRGTLSSADRMVAQRG